MAEITFSILTVATGPLAKTFTVSETDAQRVFAALVAQARPIMEDGVERPAKLGECLTGVVTRFVSSMFDETVAYEKSKSEIQPIKFAEK
ncbi:hypothetical protein UFOVP1204_15 [uncultured Caudovirales phage]|uniref:Uncharacterized protein n=1 Tax=uncultured Caudovirales phage TaxID=2100421 RepID=A0A6J5Q9J4_9CAUD|nr:hypothetical protein UFOVP473_12 [uncultured Caudovirales phage]CAB4176264.1 hypothetical protein UFOVP983_12 [uncultured Caudovirales phage]CAB4189590.1 hypothetical protein UFOVP1204_15 [uncultured Caudovirales phage]